MSRRTSRYVMVDRGYGCAENWQLAKVISSRLCNNLFDRGQSEDLLVELSGGERVWVSSWKQVMCKPVSAAG